MNFAIDYLAARILPDRKRFHIAAMVLAVIFILASLEFLKAALPLFQIRKNALGQYAKINFDDQR